jgi:hypothetical protein
MMQSQVDFRTVSQKVQHAAFPPKPSITDLNLWYSRIGILNASTAFSRLDIPAVVCYSRVELEPQ